MSKKCIAIIPARSGSKGLKDKNILSLNGLPLIAYSIIAAKQSGLFDEIFVSTDSEKYAEIAIEYGASVPFLRSKNNSSDTASSWDAVLEVINNYSSIGKQFDNICLLQPTSPLREAIDIEMSYDKFIKENANVVIGVTECDHSPLWCNTLNEKQSLNNFISAEVANLPRQLIPQYYRINGAIYWVKTKYLKNKPDFYNNTCFAYVMPTERSVDIDTILDFKICEAIIGLKNKTSV